MWYVCRLTFDEGVTSGIESSTYEGLKQGREDVIKLWGKPLIKGVNMKRIHPNEIKQGRFGEYVRNYFTENPNGAR